MKSTLVSLFLFVSSLVAAPPARPDHCVTIICKDTEGATSIGSGTVVKRFGKTVTILTCRHVIEDAEKIYLRGDDRLIEGKNPKLSDTDDLGTFEIENSDLPATKISKAPVIPGDTVQHWGNTSGYSKGEVADYLNLSYPDMAKHQALKSEYLSIAGDSGAGIFNDAGELVGVNFATIGDLGDRAGLAVPLKQVKAFLASK